MNFEPPDIFARNVSGTTEILGRKTVGIAGCGGLGSNAAVALVRAGVGHLILVDHDVVEASNLNRQYFFQNDIGEDKVTALGRHLTAINPQVVLEQHKKKIGPKDVPVIFSRAQLLIEAFDYAESKKWLIETWSEVFPERPVICASGLSGIGNTEKLGVRRAGKLVLCGDETTDMSLGLCSARVAIVANMQANVAIELLVAAD